MMMMMMTYTNISATVTRLLAFDIHGPIMKHVTTGALALDGWVCYIAYTNDDLLLDISFRTVVWRCDG